MISVTKKIVALTFLTVLSACATTSEPQNEICIANQIESNGRPCWVNTKPGEGIVVNMTKHVRPEKTREILFKSALTELSVSQNGVEVAQDAVVNKKVEEHNDTFTGRTSMTTLSVITTAKGAVEVKAKVKAVWSDNAVQKLYMWVVLEDK